MHCHPLRPDGENDGTKRVLALVGRAAARHEGDGFETFAAAQQRTHVDGAEGVIDDRGDGVGVGRSVIHRDYDVISGSERREAGEHARTSGVVNVGGEKGGASLSGDAAIGRVPTDRARILRDIETAEGVEAVAADRDAKKAELLDSHGRDIAGARGRWRDGVAAILTVALDVFFDLRDENIVNARGEAGETIAANVAKVLPKPWQCHAG